MRPIVKDFMPGVFMRWSILILSLLFQTGLQAQPAARSLNDLKSFFAANCVKCHGPDGSARSAEGKKLGGRDFTETERLAEDKDESLARTIRKGIFFGTVMPAFKDQLSEAEALLMVREVVRRAEKGKVIAPSGETPR
jgi:mono/diheme cytochrome c family protein